MPEILVGEASEFTNGEKRLVVADGVEVGLFRLDDRFFAWRNVCPHQGGPVCQGRIFRRVVDDLDEDGRLHGRRYHEADVNIVCPWHGAEFDIRTGRHAGTGRLRLMPVPTALRDGKVYLDVGTGDQ